MPRRVGDDVLAVLGGEEAVGHVDRDALLALGRKPVDQQREIDILPLRPDALAVGLEARQLVIKNLPRIVQQAPDQRRLAVVDRPAGDKAQQLLVAMPRQISRDVAGDELLFGPMLVSILAGHQK